MSIIRQGPKRLPVKIKKEMSGMLHHVQPRPGCLPTGARSAILGLLLLGVLSTITEAVQDFTCYNQKLYIGNGGNIIGGFKSGSDSDKDAGVSIQRVLDTGGGTGLPSGNGPRPHPNKRVAATIFTMNSGLVSRFGAYNCAFTPTDDQPEIQITTLIMADDAYIKPDSPTKVAVAGQPATLTMLSFSGTLADLRWRHNGNEKAEWNGVLAGTVNSVQVADAGIYECFEVSRHGEQKHGIMKLIVRECGLHSWNPSSCDKTCPVCHNGGVCDDKTGYCICAPGFSGDFCEILFGKNFFGQDSGLVCSSSNSDACRNNLMCLQDPFGCTCAASFTGENCETDCTNGTFGAGCRQQCHCANGDSCNYGHGRCTISEGECEDGFRGENCQNNCPIGRIGVNCIECPVPVEVASLTITLTISQRAISWKIASNMCPVSNYTVQLELINRDQCQPVFDTYLDVATTDSLLYNLQNPALDSPMFVPYSSYKIRVRARNEAGIGVYVDDVANDEFMTPEQAPSAAPENVTHLRVTDIGAIFQWDEVPCGSRRGDITEYSYELTKSSGILISDYTTARSQSFNDLLPCSGYTFRVAGKTSADIGVYSNETFVATETKVHLPVENLATTVSEDALDVTWDAPDVTRNPCSLHYKIEYELLNRDQCYPISSPVRSESVDQTTPGVTFDGLYAYSTYTVYVWTWNKAGLSEERLVNSTTASKEPTGSPTDFKLTSKAKHSLAISWSEIPCGQRNGIITGYTLSYRVLERPYEINFSPNSSFETVNIDPLVMQHNLSGLETSTKYEFRLAGFNSVGAGEKVRLETFTSVETEIDPPAKPSSNPKETTSSTVTIGLQLPSSSRYITGIQIGVMRRQPKVTNEKSDVRQLRSSNLMMTVDYVAAEIRKQDLPETFVVGDGKSYGGNENKPLKSDTTYDVYTGSVSRTSDTELFVAWGDPITVRVSSSSQPNGFLVVAVVVPILIVVIVVCLIIVWIKKRSNNQNRNVDASLHSHKMKVSSSNAQAGISCSETGSGSPMSNKPSSKTSCQVIEPETKKKARQYRAQDQSKGKPNEISNKIGTQQDDYEKIGQYQPSAYESIGDGSVTTYEDVGLPTWAQPWSVLWVDMMVGSKVLGEGHFGEVRLGGVMKEGEFSKAAIKKLKAHASVTDRQNFMTEFHAMTQVGYHPNVVQIIGVCQHEDELYIALEYLPNGDLCSFLREARDDDSQASLTSEKLLQFAVGVAKGMQHLAASGVIHRDLAARNILLDDNLVAKVSDFGLSRGENIYVQRSKTPVPTRWLSLESLFNQTYTTKSDVWSFGILLWEIAAFGGTPYSGIKTQGLATKLSNGYRMPKPDNCSDEIYKLMLKCWEKDPNNRPEFRTLVSMLTSLGESDIEHTYMKVPMKFENMTYEKIRSEFDDN